MLVRNELPVRGDVDFRGVGLEPGTDRGGKTFKEGNKMTREPVFSVILSGVTHCIFSHLRIRNKLPLHY